MTRLQRYVLSHFARPLIFSYGALTLMVLMSELMERLDKFIAGKASADVVFRYLLVLWPVRTQELIPVAALLATLFCLGQLSRRQEITAALSGGIHPWRLTAPLFLAGIGLSLASWGLGETVTPWANREAKRLWNEDVRRLTSPRTVTYEGVTVAAKGAFYSLGSLEIEKQVLRDVVIDITENGRPKIQWQAKEGYWTPLGWKLKDGVERVFDGEGLQIVQQRRFKDKVTRRREKPADLLPREPDTDEMNRSGLSQHIERLQILGVPTHKLEVEWHMKGAFPWANLIVILIGVPFAFNKRGGKVKAIGLALGVAFGYFGLMQVGRALGQKPWCPPAMGAWLANLVFLGVGLRETWKMKSLS